MKKKNPSGIHFSNQKFHGFREIERFPALDSKMKAKTREYQAYFESVFDDFEENGTLFFAKVRSILAFRNLELSDSSIFGHFLPGRKKRPVSLSVNGDPFCLRAPLSAFFTLSLRMELED